MFNKLVSNNARATVKRTFRSMSKWFGAGIAKYIGETKTHALQYHIHDGYYLLGLRIWLDAVQGLNHQRKPSLAFDKDQFTLY